MHKQLSVTAKSPVGSQRKVLGSLKAILWVWYCRALLKYIHHSMYHFAVCKKLKIVLAFISKKCMLICQALFLSFFLCLFLLCTIVFQGVDKYHRNQKCHYYSRVKGTCIFLTWACREASILRVFTVCRMAYTACFHNKTSLKVYTCTYIHVYVHKLLMNECSYVIQACSQRLVHCAHKL